MKSLIEIIDEIATSHPDWPAVNTLGELKTYGELKAASDGIAAALQARHLPAKAPLMVYCDQSFAAIATFLGCVKAGHAYIPVDSHSPNDRLTMIEEIAHPALVLATIPLPLKLKTTTVEPAQVKQMMAVAPTENVELSADDNFYIIFTSGTTGQPKGVQISHANLISFVSWMASFNLPRRPRMLAQAPFSFDLSVMSLYPTLTAGGCLQILPKEQTENLKALFETLPHVPVDVWVSTPSFVDICLLSPLFDATNYPALKQFYFCGEELTHATAEKLRQRFPQAKIYNTYGPTEATVAVTAVEITDSVLADYPRLPIGYAKPDTTMTLVPGTVRTEDDQQVGELEIIGLSVSKGYLNRPEKTAAAFTEEHGMRGYRTGDLGIIAEDGLIFYRGRTDFQIKLNGYRIELEEVDHYLNQAPMIHQAVAVPKYNAEHKVQQMLAYVVPEQGEEGGLALTKKIRAHLQQVMMPYMIPQRFIYKAALPLTPNGKVAVKALISEVNA